MEFVRMTHPDIDAVSGRVTRKAFDEVYAERGFEIADDGAVAASDVLDEPVTDLGRLNKAQLVEVATARGLAFEESATKADLVQIIEASA